MYARIVRQPIDELARPGPMRRPPARSRLALVGATMACCALLGAPALSGCGASSDDNGGEKTTKNEGSLGPNIVTDEQLQKYPKDSPERAALAWWQAFQFADQSYLEENTTAKMIDEIGERRFDKLVEKVGSSFGRLKIAGVRRSSKDRTLIRAAIVTYRPRARRPEPGVPVGLEMRRVEGRWKMDAVAYFKKVAKDAL